MGFVVEKDNSESRIAVTETLKLFLVAFGCGPAATRRGNDGAWRQSFEDFSINASRTLCRRQKKIIFS